MAFGQNRYPYHNGRLTPESPVVSTVRVPGSSANLGPGFDSLGIALNVHLTCRFWPAAVSKVCVSGRDAELIPATGQNLIVTTAQAVAARSHRQLPGFELEIANEIPLGKGLGSSAAAIVAGVTIAERLLKMGWKVGRILDEAVRIEGHPDNVSASILGSIVSSAVDAGGMTRAVRLPLPAKMGVCVVVPNYNLPTKESRAVLPETYSRADAIFNVQRVALLVASLATGDIAAFPTALEDRMHQPFRAKLVPGLTEILRLRAPGLLGCVLSGAGPAVLVFYETGHEKVAELVRQIFAMNGFTTEIITCGVSGSGYELS